MMTNTIKLRPRATLTPTPHFRIYSYLYVLVTFFMLKFLIIIFVVSYVMYKVGSFFFKIGAASQQMQNRNRQQANTSEAKKNSDGKIKGGDYVDYEEVK